jgi:hypothetical protein
MYYDIPVWRSTSLRDDIGSLMRTSGTPLSIRSLLSISTPNPIRRRSSQSGPTEPGHLLEVIMLELAGGELLAIHAMPLRSAFHDLLPRGGDDDD